MSSPAPASQGGRREGEATVEGVAEWLHDRLGAASPNYDAAEWTRATSIQRRFWLRLARVLLEDVIWHRSPSPVEAPSGEAVSRVMARMDVTALDAIGKIPPQDLLMLRDEVRRLRYGANRRERREAEGEADATLAICRAVWPLLHPGTKYDGWSHWPVARELRQVVAAALAATRQGQAPICSCGYANQPCDLHSATPSAASGEEDECEPAAFALARRILARARDPKREDTEAEVLATALLAGAGSGQKEPPASTHVAPCVFARGTVVAGGRYEPQCTCPPAHPAPSEGAKDD